MVKHPDYCTCTKYRHHMLRRQALREALDLLQPMEEDWAPFVACIRAGLNAPPASSWPAGVSGHPSYYMLKLATVLAEELLAVGWIMGQIPLERTRAARALQSYLRTLRS